MGGSSKSSTTNQYDYSQSEEYTNIQGGTLALGGSIGRGASVNITDGGAVEAAARVSEQAIRAAEAGNLAAFDLSARTAEGAHALGADAMGLVGGITEKFGSLASEANRLSTSNTQSALNAMKEFGRADAGAGVDMFKWGAVAVAAVTVALILKGGKR